MIFVLKPSLICSRGHFTELLDLSLPKDPLGFNIPYLQLWKATVQYLSCTHFLGGLGCLLLKKLKNKRVITLLPFKTGVEQQRKGNYFSSQLNGRKLERKAVTAAKNVRKSEEMSFSVRSTTSAGTCC